MMDAKERDVASRLGIDPDNPTVQRGLDLFNADADLLDALVQLRRAKGLTQEEVGQRMDRDRTSVTRFERLDSDPHLSTVRRYALAVGATIAHEVKDVDAPPAPASPPPVPQPAERPPSVFTWTLDKWLDEVPEVERESLNTYTRSRDPAFALVRSEDPTLSAMMGLVVAIPFVKGAAPLAWRRPIPSYESPPKDQLELWVQP